MTDEEFEYYISNILVQNENQVAQLNQVMNDLSITKSYLETQNVRMAQIIDNQDRTISACSVYIGCCNLILMVLLLCRFLPARKGVLKK